LFSESIQNDFLNIGMPTACYEFSALELWARDGDFSPALDEDLANATQEDILSVINGGNFSGRFMIERNFSETLGGVQRDQRGNVVSAKALLFRFLGRMDAVAAKEQGVSINSAVGEYVRLSLLYSNYNQQG
jgi:hypothetical protein